MSPRTPGKGLRVLEGLTLHLRARLALSRALQPVPLARLPLLRTLDAPLRKVVSPLRLRLTLIQELDHLGLGPARFAWLPRPRLIHYHLYRS